MKSSRKIRLLPTVSLLLVAIFNARVINGYYEVTTSSSAEKDYSWPLEDDLTYEDYGITENWSNLVGKPISSYNTPPQQRKYIVTLIKLNWYAAYAFCEQNGWSLVSIESVSVQFQVQNYLNYFNLQSNTFWTSGNKLADLQNYRWGYSGSKFSYTTWATGQPDNLIGGQHCVKLQENTLKWDDDFCENIYHFICQMDKNTTASTLPS